MTVKLPVGPHQRALESLHFPDRAHAIVWRNWTLVEPQRLARVLGTSSQNVEGMAASMGLPLGREVSTRMLEHGYFTLLRLNWHLLPYEQLLVLLDMSAEKLDFILREDDLAFIKLGNVKPACAPLRYQEPDGATQARAAAIKQTVQHYLGDLNNYDEQPRFGFLDQWRASGDTGSRRQDSSAIHDGLRFVYSYCALFGDPLIDPALDLYPDGLLDRLADLGINGVWMHVVLRQLAPGSELFPQLGQGHERRLESLRQLVERAGQYGIGIYLYLNEPRSMPIGFFDDQPDAKGVQEGNLAALCTSSPKVLRWLGDALTHVFEQVPRLAGVFTITASENLTFCHSHGRGDQCPRCSQRSDDEVTAEVNAVIEAAVHRASPDARVIVWDWGWKAHGEAPTTISALPDGVWLLSVSEWSQPIERGGVKTCIGEHCLSVVGPGPRARTHWQLARQRGLKTAACINANCSTELLSLPTLPVLDLVAEHAASLAKERVDGVMISWSFGGYPSANLRIFQLLAERPQRDIGDILDQIARESYGPDAVDDARRAWSACSAAFGQFPSHISVLYYGPQHMGPANLLHLHPTGYNAGMVGIPYDDLERWRGPYPPDVLAGQFERVANGWTAGLNHLEKVVASADEAKRPQAAGDLLVAQAAYLQLASAANQTRFIMLRDRWRADETPVTERQTLGREMIGIIDREVGLAQQLYKTAVLDSRIGFEATCHYFYTPLELVEQIINCQYIKQQLVVMSSSPM